ncbi:T9SS type A sorting domain-containing protein [bacterium]|nr:T9SS type A sorting domain-containing protein [bacterium]
MISTSKKFARLCCLAALSLVCSNSIHAQTEVSGEVWGRWSSEGSPYLVTDTVLVPQDSSLFIDPGVVIEFQDQIETSLPFYVHGALHAVGAEEDSIYFLSPEAPFHGIVSPMEIDGSIIHLEYCVIDSAERAIESWYGLYSTIRHSSITAVSAIEANEEPDTLEFCTFHPPPGRAYLGAVLLNGGPYLIKDCDAPETRISVGFSPTTRITGNTLQSLSVEGGEFEISSNQITFSVSLGGADVDWLNNTVNRGFTISGGQVVIDSSEFDFLISIQASNCEVDIRNSSLTFGENNLGNPILFSNSTVSLTNNIFKSRTNGIRLSGVLGFYCRNNTIQSDDNGIYCSGSEFPDQIIENNIFVGDGNHTGIKWLGNNEPIIRYNCFSNVPIPVENTEMGDGNVLADALFKDGDPFINGEVGFDYHLRPDSPCIDAGNPELPLDPDGTRSDIGAFFYNQSQDNPPAIISPVEVIAQTSAEFRYHAEAIDDHGPLDFAFTGLPEGLQVRPSELDWTRNGPLIHGIPIPPDSVDDDWEFDFTIHVEDGLGQEDSQTVHVRMQPCTVIGGEMTGIISAENSPYLVTETIVIPEGDSLRIEPGVELKFRYETNPDFRPGLIAYGKLTTIGTAQDSIRFIGEHEEPRYEQWGNIQLFNTEDTTRFSHCVILDADDYISLTRSAAMIIRNSRIDINGYCIRSYPGSYVYADSCYFRATALYLQADSATVIVHSSTFQREIGDYPTVLHVLNSSTLLVRNSIFFRGVGISTGSYGEIIGSQFYNSWGGVGYGGGSSGEVRNCIFFNLRSDESQTWGVNINSLPLKLLNNNFINNDVGIRSRAGQNNGDTLLSLSNNILMNNYYGVYSEIENVVLENIIYNNFFNNDTTLVNCEVGENNLFIDPLFADTTDYFLFSNSPMIDAGHPDPIFNDVDGTRNDIGLWGGPYGHSYDYPVSVAEDSKTQPSSFRLGKPFPNPFNSVQMIPFTLPDRSTVTVTVVNIEGRQVRKIDLGELQPDSHTFLWMPKTEASGTYFITVSTEKHEATVKSILAR